MVPDERLSALMSATLRVSRDAVSVVRNACSIVLKGLERYAARNSSGSSKACATDAETLIPPLFCPSIRRVAQFRHLLKALGATSALDPLVSSTAGPPCAGPVLRLPIRQLGARGRFPFAA